MQPFRSTRKHPNEFIAFIGFVYYLVLNLRIVLKIATRICFTKAKFTESVTEKTIAISPLQELLSHMGTQINLANDGVCTIHLLFKIKMNE